MPVNVPLTMPPWSTDKASELSPKVLMFWVPAKFKVLVPSTETPVEFAPEVAMVASVKLAVEPAFKSKPKESAPKVVMLASFTVKVLVPSTKAPVEPTPSVLTVELVNVVVEPLVKFKPKEPSPVVLMVASAIARLAAED